MIIQSRRFIRKLFNAKNPSACYDKIMQFFCGNRLNAFCLNQKKNIVFPRAVMQITVMDNRIKDYFFRHIITAIPVLMDGFPYQCLISGMHQRRERLVLCPVDAPHISYWRKNGDASVHFRLTQKGCEPCPVIREIFHIGPPWVALTEKGSVARPAGECGC